MASLDVDFVRQQFPAFADESLQDWAFFENAGESYACRQVIERLNDARDELSRTFYNDLTSVA